jgi:hypothetical protein
MDTAQLASACRKRMTDTQNIDYKRTAKAMYPSTGTMRRVSQIFTERDAENAGFF